MSNAAPEVPEVTVHRSLSPSRAADFMTCPLLYRFRVIDRLPEARKGLDIILDLFMVERDAASADIVGTEAHLELRRSRSAPILDRLAAWMKETGRAFSREAAIAKLFASESAIAVCNDAVQIHGGYGYTRDFAAERHLRDARVTTIYEGTSEIQRLVIARSALA